MGRQAPDNPLPCGQCGVCIGEIPPNFRVWPACQRQPATRRTTNATRFIRLKLVWIED